MAINGRARRQLNPCCASDTLRAGVKSKWSGPGNNHRINIKENINMKGLGNRSIVLVLLFFGGASTLYAQARQAPPGVFKQLDDAVRQDAQILRGRQLFIDDDLIESMDGVARTLHQPVKHAANPLVVQDRAWEEGGPGYTTVLYDPHEKVFRMWYGYWIEDAKPSEQVLCYATSGDGIHWEKPVLNEQTGSNKVSIPRITGFQCAGIFRDPMERNQEKRFKMLFSAAPDGTSQAWATGAAYSPDGITWTLEPEFPLIPFSDTQICPFWDPQRGRYVAHLRYGPPNDRIAARIESEDFVHWSPKVTLFSYRQSRLDRPFQTQHYQMTVAPYHGNYIGLMFAYHGETIQPIPEDELWRDKSNTQLTYSRNGVTWLRVGHRGAYRPHELVSEDRDWKAESTQATFIPYGEHGQDWDWGSAYPAYQPVLTEIDDTIYLYYVGTNTRHWASYHGDKDKKSGIGLATLRADGFVSVEGNGTLTTKPLVFLGDTLLVNADARGGTLRVEAMDASGKVIEGFSRNDCTPIVGDSVRHVVTWNENPDCNLIQARPIRLRFYMENAKIYSFEARIQNKHYIQSYD